MSVTKSENSLIMFVNGVGVAVAYGMLGISLWLSTNVPLATKGFWGMAVLLLTLSLINFVKYRFDEKMSEDRINRIEAARNEKLLENIVKQISGKEAKLSNENFVKRAPADVVEKERASLADLHQQQETVASALKRLRESNG